MLIIRREQMDAFSPLIRKKFVDEVLAYIRGYYPEDCEALGDEQTRRAIDLGVDRAAAHGFDIKGDVCSYITLMFSLGSYFDEDPLVPWTAEVLEDKETDRSAVMERLYAKTKNYLRMVAGENGQYYRSALLVCAGNRLSRSPRRTPVIWIRIFGQPSANYTRNSIKRHLRTP